MRDYLVSIILAALCLSLAQPCSAADQTLREWNYSNATDTLGWKSVGGQIGFDKGNGAMTSTGADCKVVSPLFEIRATPWQIVEIEMKADKDGIARLFYSNTTDEPYGGFREELQTQVQVLGDNQFRKYVAFPGWQNQGKILHIRIDPPGQHNEIKSVRILELGVEKSTNGTNWQFMDTAAGWHTFGIDKEPVLSKGGWGLSGSRYALAVSPALDVSSDELPYLTLRMASFSPHTVIFRWMSSDRNGIQSLPINVKGGGKMHSYVINLSAIEEWSGKISGVGITPADSANPYAITVESVALAKAPVGPAEIKINRLELASPVARVGAKSKIRMEIENIGGTEANGIAGVVTLMETNTPKTLPVKTLNSLPTGKTAVLEWETTFSSEGAVMAASSAGTGSMDPDQKQAQFHVLPKLSAAVAKSMKGVPEPQIADTGDYSVGCYYFPGWREYGAWSVLNDFPERKPVLGYASDGNPEVVDWQINWALSHGINFFIYDWYWNKGSRGLEEGLHDGFFKAKHQDKMKFCLLWANHNGVGSHSESDMLAVTKYWIDNYFKRPNYVKLNGKNVMVIFNPGGIIGDMGVDGAKTAFDKMRKMCEDSGVGGLYMVACAYPNADWIKQFEKAGFDAFSGYNYPAAGDRGQNVAPYEWMLDGYKDIWNQMASTATVPYIPLCEAGWDSRPWGGPNARVRSGKSADLFQKMLSNAKDYDDAPSRKLPEGKKLVFLEAWNEFGEGDYIEPNAGFGFDYLEAVRQVFAPKSKRPTIITPTDLGMGPYDLKPPVARTEWDFSKPDARTWNPAGFANVSYDEGTLRAETTNRDPILWGQPTQIDTSKYKTLEIRMKTDKSDEGQIFFTQKRYQQSEERSLRFATNGDGQFHTYTLNMKSNKLWNGIVTGLRFDPTGISGAKIEIASIRFVQQPG